MIFEDSSTTETAEEAWRSFQLKTSTFFANTAESLSAFFKNNKPLLINLGWVLLVLLGLQLLFTILDVVDNLPLISPILKLVGLLSTSWFVWRYLLRASNRQELGQIIDRTKSELLGDRS
ncbi:CAAD domain-containing protein [Leptolyngbyaceae cyanobacterium UHCC 1019]